MILYCTEDLTDYGNDVADGEVVDPNDNTLDLFEILRGHRPSAGTLLTLYFLKSYIFIICYINWRSFVACYGVNIVILLLKNKGIFTYLWGSD